MKKRLSKFERWFNYYVGWFFTNGNKYHQLENYEEEYLQNQNTSLL